MSRLTQALAYTVVVIGIAAAAFGAYVRFTHQTRF